MSYQEFSDKILAVMRMMYPKCTVEIIDVKKINNLSLKGLVIRSQDSTVVPNVYMESFYKLYKMNWRLEDIVLKIKEAYEEALPRYKIDMSFFKDFEQVKDRIVYRLINTKENEELLQRIPHVQFWDLAICFSYAYFSEELGEGSILIHNNHMEMWNVDIEMLMELAKVNTPRVFPVHFCDIKDALPDINEEQKLMLGILGEGCMYVLTNKKKMHGAAAMLYPQVLPHIAEIIQRDFIIIPSSLHEVLILPVIEEKNLSEQIRAIRKMVAEVNKTQLDQDEILTNNPFFYWYAEKELVQLYCREYFVHGRIDVNGELIDGEQ